MRNTGLCGCTLLHRAHAFKYLGFLLRRFGKKNIWEQEVFFENCGSIYSAGFATKEDLAKERRRALSHTQTIEQTMMKKFRSLSTQMVGLKSLVLGSVFEKEVLEKYKSVFFGIPGAACAAV